MYNAFRFFVVSFLFCVASFAHAQTGTTTPLLFDAPRLGERLVSGETYEFRLNRNPAAPGVWNIRTSEGALLGTLLGSSTPNSFIWNVGSYATATLFEKKLEPGNYHVVYHAAGGRILARSFPFYLEPRPSVSTPVVVFGFEGETETQLTPTPSVSFQQGVKGYGAGLNTARAMFSGPVPAAELVREPVTLSVWMKVDPNLRVDVAPLAGVWPATEKDFGYRLILENGRPRFDVGGTTTPLSWIGGGGLELGKWHHIVATLERTALNEAKGVIYVNGKQDPFLARIDREDGGYSRAPYRGTFAVGGDPAGLFATFGGVIDEVSVYNAALSPDDVARLYETERPNKPAQRFSIAGLAAAVFRPFFTLFGF